MAKVFIVNDTHHDYSGAMQFGELVSITEGQVPIFKTGVLSNIIEDKLKDFTEEDYVLVSGPAIVNVMVSTTLYNRFETIKFLIFDAKQQEYVVRHLYK